MTARELAEAAREVLARAGGHATVFLGESMGFVRTTGLDDRAIDVYVRDGAWNVAYVHAPSGRSATYAGTTSASLESTLEDLCAPTAPEPPDSSESSVIQ